MHRIVRCELRRLAGSSLLRAERRYYIRMKPVGCVAEIEKHAPLRQSLRACLRNSSDMLQGATAAKQQHR